MGSVQPSGEPRRSRPSQAGAADLAPSMSVLPSARTGPGAASVQDASSFARPRELAACLGLTPKRNPSGGKRRLGRISRMGNRRLRKVLVAD